MRGSLWTRLWCAPRRLADRRGSARALYSTSSAHVLTISLHSHPRFAYPYFSGFEDERGAGPGEGFNHSFALPEPRVSGL